MKRIALLLLLLASTPLFAQEEIGTLGVDFWVAFMPNWHDYDADTYTLALCAQRECTATVINPQTGWSQSYDLYPTNPHVITVPTSQGWHEGSCVTTNCGLHIIATDSIQVFACNQSGTLSQCDATILYTTASLGNDYYVQTYPATSSDPDAHPQFSILAVVDSTVVDIVLRGATSTGATSNTTLTVTLNAGQVYQVQGATGTNGDLTGTRVTSLNHDCFPFALFMGNSVTNIPSTPINSVDHTFLQALPVTSWQSEWILIPSSYSGQDCIKITSNQNGTNLTVNDTLVTTLQNGQSYIFSTNQPSHIVTSHPALLVQYTSSRSDDNDGNYGDVSAFIPNSLSCTTRQSYFSTFTLQTRGSYPNYWILTAVAPSSEIGSLTLDGAPLLGTPTPVPGTAYSYIRYYASDNFHLLSTSQSGFVAHCTGLSENYQSYTTSLGGGIPLAIDPVITIDTAYDTVCAYPYHYRNATLYHDGEYHLALSCSHIRHLFLSSSTPDTTYSDTTLCGSQYTWFDSTYTQSGSLFHTAGRDRHGCDSIFHLQLQLWPTYDTTAYYQVCDSTLTYHDTTFVITPQTIHHTYHLQTIHGCDSAVHLTIEPGVPLFTTINYGSCDDTLYPYLDTFLTIPGTYTYDYTSTYGCDSTVTLQLTQYPSYLFLTEDTLLMGQQYQWVDGIKYEDSTDTYLTLETDHGCDSIYHLILHITYPPYAPIWIPNAFTPNKSENSTFRIQSENVSEMTVSIYNRFGDLVHTFDGLTQEWDGTHHGTPCPQGTYVYHIRYLTPITHGQPMPLTGTVLLIR